MAEEIKEIKEMAEQKPIIMSKMEVSTLAMFLVDVVGIAILQADEPIDGLKGHVAFYHIEGENYDKEATLWFAYRYGKPVPEYLRTPISNDRMSKTEIEERVKKCLREPGWKSCDNLKKLILGFVKYASLDSEEETDALFVKLSTFKTLSAEIGDEFNEWRKNR